MTILSVTFEIIDHYVNLPLLIIKLLHLYPHLPQLSHVCLMCSTGHVSDSFLLDFNSTTSVEKVLVSIQQFSKYAMYEFYVPGNL